jgi:streptomycin 6-kinase
LIEQPMLGRCGSGTGWPARACRGRDRAVPALPETADCQVLLCTDLHGDNILAAQRAPWLVIDPKPYVGDPAYDLLQHMLNCQDRLAADPAGLANRMATLAGVDAGRVRQWLFAWSVQESIGSPLMRQVARRLAPT